MESQQPRNRLREKCGYVHGSIRSITGERPDVYASGRTDAERGVIEGWLTWQVGHAEGGRFQPQARGADGDRVSPRCQPRLEPCRLMPPL